MKRIKPKIYNSIPKKLKIIWDRVEGSDIGRRIFSGAFWSLFSSVISRGAMLIASIVIARIIGKVEFGELGMIRSTVSMFAVFAGFGLGLTATKYIAEFRKKDKVKTGKIIGLTNLFAGGSGIIIAIVILIGAPFLAEKTINAPHLINEIRIAAIILFFNAINGAQTGALMGFEAFKTIAKVNFISAVVAFPIQIGFTMLFGLSGSLLGLGFNYFLLWLLNFMAVRKESLKYGIKIHYKNSFDEWDILYKFSLPALLSGIMVIPILWVCNAMLVSQPKGYEEMALFDAANQWRLAILFIPAMLSQIALPILSGSDNQIQYNRILKLNLLLNFIVALFLAIGISLFSTLIMNFYGKGFGQGNIILIILALTTILISINEVVGKAIISKGKMWHAFLFNSIWGMILLSSSYILIKQGFGAKGLAIAYVISYSFHTIIQFIFLNRIQKFKINVNYTFTS